VADPAQAVRNAVNVIKNPKKFLINTLGKNAELAENYSKVAEGGATAVALVAPEAGAPLIEAAEGIHKLAGRARDAAELGKGVLEGHGIETAKHILEHRAEHMVESKARGAVLAGQGTFDDNDDDEMPVTEEERELKELSKKILQEAKRYGTKYVTVQLFGQGPAIAAEHIGTWTVEL